MSDPTTELDPAQTPGATPPPTVTPAADYLSPLDQHAGETAPPTSLRGGVVVDPELIALIAARVAYTRLPWWRRWLAPRPAGYRRPASDAFVEAPLLAGGVEVTR